MTEEKIHMYTLKGDWVASFKNIYYAEMITGIKKYWIYKNLTGEWKHGGGYLWGLKRRKHL